MATLNVLPRDWVFGEKVIRCPRKYVRKVGARTRSKDVTEDVIPLTFELVRFSESTGRFHGYLVDKDNLSSAYPRQRRLWMQLSRDGTNHYTLMRVGTVRSEQKIPFRSIKNVTPSQREDENMRPRKRKRRGRRNDWFSITFEQDSWCYQGKKTSKTARRFGRKARDVWKTARGTVKTSKWMNLPLSDTIVEKDEMVHQKKRKLDHRTQQEKCPSTPRSSFSIHHVGDDGREAENDDENTLTPLQLSVDLGASTANARSPSTDQAPIFNLIQMMQDVEREEKAKSAMSMMSMPHDHDLVKVLNGDESKLERLRQLAAENFKTTGSIPTPEAPLPATVSSNSLHSVWSKKHQCVAMLRCRCDEHRPRWIGYVAWIEFTASDPTHFVPPPIVLQVYVDKSHRGTNAPHQGHFGKRMVEWVARRTSRMTACEVLCVASPNMYSQRMLSTCGWFEVSSRKANLPPCVCQGNLYLRFRGTLKGEL